MYSIIPFGLLFMVNLFLIVFTCKLERNSQTFNRIRKRKQKKLTYTIIILTWLFILATLPYYVGTAYLYIEMQSSLIGKCIQNFLSILSFSYHSLNFVIFFVSNKIFLKETKEIVLGLKMWFNSASNTII